MIITTTSNIEGYKITKYHELVFGEVIIGTNFLTDIGASIMDFIGGRSKGYENTLIEARVNAIEEIKMRAAALGANAVVACKIDMETIGSQNAMIMVTCSGTAVTIEPNN